MSREQSTYAYGVNGAISNAGQFLSALILGELAVGMGISDERGMILMASWGYVLLTIFCIGLTLLWNRRRR